MENLWKKESDEAGARYVDLFDIHLEENEDEELIDEFAKLRTSSAGDKSNQSSREYQKHGDDLLRDENWGEAMDAYNKSLCFAEASQNVSIIYFHRSICFFRLNMWDKALADIQIAENLNIPTRLLSKLNRLKRKCLKLLENIQKLTEVIPNLSYEANENHPSLANVIDIKYNRTFGRHLVATANIPVGKTVLLAKSFASAIIAKIQVHCHTCSRTKMNFIPCKYCSDVMFCNEDCANHNNLHEMECQTCYHQISHIKTKLIVKTILIALDIFPNIENLIAFVEETTKDIRYDKIPIKSSDASSQYGVFLELAPFLKYEYVDNNANYAFEIITSMPKVMRLFDTESKRRFLMHLVLHHMMVIPKNAFGNEDQCRTEEIFDVLSLVNHSCKPNLDFSCKRDILYCKSVRKINKGDQVFINYLGAEVDEPTNQRRISLKKYWGFDCNCDNCDPKVTESYQKF